MKYITTNLYSVQKTLRFELKPVLFAGETREQALARITREPFFANDAARERSYEDVKKLIDDYLSELIAEKLSDAKIDWQPLSDAIGAREDEPRKKAEEAARKSVVGLLGNADDFLNKNLIENVLPQRLKSASAQNEKSEALANFKKFSTYFTGFWENRKNVFSDKDRHTALAFRIVNENFPKFRENINAFESAPDSVREQLAKNFPDTNLKEFFSVPAFNNLLTQRGIDLHNAIVGGKSGETGTEKIQGFNELVNLWSQNNPEEKSPQKMQLLYKQILSESENAFSARFLQTDEEVVALLKSLRERIFGVPASGGVPAVESAGALLSSVFRYDKTKVWISLKTVREIARAIFGRWDALNTLLNIRDATEDSARKNEQLISLAEIESALREKRKTFETEADAEPLIDSLEDFFAKIQIEIENETGTERKFVAFAEFSSRAKEKLDAAVAAAESATPRLCGNENCIKEIKSALDDVLTIARKVRALKPPEKHLRRKPCDETFYAEFDNMFLPFAEFASIYDKIRNYLTKKVYDGDKMKLCFDCPTLANGWDENKIEANHALILRRNGKYFLGILNSAADTAKRREILSLESENDVPADECFERMEYKYLAGPRKMLPKVFLSSKEGIKNHKPPQNLIDKETRDRNPEELIRFYQNEIPKYDKGAWKIFNFQFKKPEEYASTQEFLDDVERQNFRIGFRRVPVKKIEEFVAARALFLFEIYNKDFADGARGAENLHTIFWKAVFSQENADAGFPIKLNGEAEIFWRKASLGVNETPVHAAGSVLVNRRDADGNVIPEKNYQEIFKFKNGKITEAELSKEAKEILANKTVRCKKAKTEIRKNRRYTVDKFLFHVPLTLNRTPREKTFKLKEFNEKIRERACSENSPIKIIGIDRGERNLISLVMINQTGKIELQKSFNVIEEKSGEHSRETDYHSLLSTREKERDEARKTWKSIGKIADLKNGYISQVVHQISKLIVENNAIVVLEDLNVGFKRGRFKIERQVYQKFEKALIEKLNFLVFKDYPPTAAGGVLNAFQLTGKFESFEKLSNQSGILFYVPAGYTSKIDPKTGFANIFDFSGLTNVKKKQEFFSKFPKIYFDAGTASFAFEFDYKNFTTYKQKFARTQWCVYSRGKRLIWNAKDRKTEEIDPTKQICEALSGLNISYVSGENLKDKIGQASLENATEATKASWDKLFRAFKYSLQLRNSRSGSTKAKDDRIISPVKADDGSFFDSGEQPENGALPRDADANGAFHIALKGLLGIRKKFAKKWSSNESWFEFVQKTLRERHRPS